MLTVPVQPSLLADTPFAVNKSQIGLAGDTGALPPLENFIAILAFPWAELFAEVLIRINDVIFPINYRDIAWYSVKKLGVEPIL
jgi:hypothetical protein